jgi:ABC-2 type transport system permease protein
MIEFYKKELKLLFRNKTNVILMFVLPILLIALMSYAFSNFMNTETTLFNNGKVYVQIQETDGKYFSYFMNAKNDVEERFNIDFEEITDYDTAVESVNKQEAYGIITVGSNGYEYYRSPYNETKEGEYFRQMFTAKLNSAVSGDDNQENSNVELIQESKITSKEYFSFVELSLVMMFISYVISNILYQEHQDKTLNRVLVSKARISGLFGGKIFTGMTIGIIQIIEVYLFSSFVFRVNWGKYTLLIFLVYILIALFSTLVGIVCGYLIKNKDMLDLAILMCAMIFAFFGGTLTPLTALKSYSALRVMIQVSPLYWANTAIMHMYSGELSSDFATSVIILGILNAVLLAICVLIVKKNKKAIR